jgi:methylated-DNA-protein-cysteine methyltransferase related protein
VRSKPATSFPRQVYEIVLQVPAGRVITYGLIARLLGEPRKARQVGWAMAATPAQSPAIPAHRVINARGELSGGHAFGGYTVQRARLEAEGVEFLDDGRIDLDTYLWLPHEKAPPRRRGLRQEPGRDVTRGCSPRGR